MPRVLRFAPLFLLLSACGGGGGGAGGGQPASAASEPAPANTSRLATAGSQRSIAAACPFSQNIGAARGDGLRIAAVNWLQTVALDPAGGDTRLMAGKSVRVRVDILSNNGAPLPSGHDLLVRDSSGACQRISLSGPAQTPTAIDRDSLQTAYTADIPAALVQPGLQLSIVLDDDNGRSASEADQTYRVLAADVAPATSELVRIIPVRYQGFDGYVNSPKELAALLVRMHPLSSVSTRFESVFSPPSLLGVSGNATFETMKAVLNDVDNRCHDLNGSQASASTAPKCLAVFPDNLVFRPAGDPRGKVVGLAYVGGISMLTESVDSVDVMTVTSPYDSQDWLQFRAVTVAHEMGHLLDLQHAACGGADGTDPRLYADGRLDGGAGYDSLRGFYFSSQRMGSDGKPLFSDLMSYCDKEWSSDRGYLAAMSYRTPVPGSTKAAPTSTTSARWLKVSRTASGWDVRKVDFAPATVAASDLGLGVLSNRGREHLPLVSAVIADAAAAGQGGPYYVNLGDRQVVAMQLLKAGALVQDLSAAALKGP